MNTIDNTALADLTAAMLERTAMIFAEPAEIEDDGCEPVRFARIRLTGPSEGFLLLSASEGFLRELAAGMLGIENSDVDLKVQGDDALKEMANMVGGSIIATLSGDTGTYALGLPELVTSPTVPGSKHAECHLTADGGSLRVLYAAAA